MKKTRFKYIKTLKPTYINEEVDEALIDFRFSKINGVVSIIAVSPEIEPRIASEDSNWEFTVIKPLFL